MNTYVLKAILIFNICFNRNASISSEVRDDKDATDDEV